MGLFTRREIIKLWLSQPTDVLDSYVCPNCWDILFKKLRKNNVSYYCDNPKCTNYKLELKDEK